MRRRPLAIVDDQLCIDLPCDARDSFLAHGVDPKKLRYVLITHGHYDHFMGENMLTRPQNANKLDVYISTESGEGFVKKCGDLRHARIPAGMPPVNVPNVNFLSPYETVQAGSYEVTALPANHAPRLGSLNYILSSEGKTILWLHDSGILLPDVKSFLAKKKFFFNFVSMDCALPKGSPASNEHMDLIQCAETAEFLRSIQAIDDGTKLYLAHISHLVGQTHEEMAQDAKCYGFHVAYDGEIVFI